MRYAKKIKITKKNKANYSAYIRWKTDYAYDPIEYKYIGIIYLDIPTTEDNTLPDCFTNPNKKIFGIPLTYHLPERLPEKPIAHIDPSIKTEVLFADPERDSDVVPMLKDPHLIFIREIRDSSSWESLLQKVEDTLNEAISTLRELFDKFCSEMNREFPHGTKGKVIFKNY